MRILTFGGNVVLRLRSSSWVDGNEEGRKRKERLIGMNNGGRKITKNKKVERTGMI
jgi:hypothetical protein